MFHFDKRILNSLVIVVFTFITFWWTFFIFHLPFDIKVVFGVLVIRLIASRFIYSDYNLSWSKSSPKTFLLKSFVYISAFIVYLPIYYGYVRFSFLASELFLYIFSINFVMYLYSYIVNKSLVKKTKSVVVYGAGKAGVKLASEFADTEYKVEYFVDDDKAVQNRSIDSVQVFSKDKLKEELFDNKLDLLVIAMPSSPKDIIKEIYNELSENFNEVQVLPSLDEILKDKDFATQLKNISVEDLLARHPKDLDKDKISEFIKDKVVLVTGAGGSIGSEICRQCKIFGVKKLIALDHSEFNLYSIVEELDGIEVVPIMQSVVNLQAIDDTFKTHMPDIVIHAAAYKHVPLVESNIDEGIINNVLGTKNVIDTSIKYKVKNL